jgi:hypothetical protein
MAAAHRRSCGETDNRSGAIQSLVKAKADAARIAAIDETAEAGLISGRFFGTA